MSLYIDLVGNSTLTLEFQLLDSPITKLWMERMNSRGQYPLDHPDRFYGFNSLEEEVKRAEYYIRSCIDTVNNYQLLIDRPFTNYQDQDCLNYLHNIFERYHGQLDQQDTEFWNQAPYEVRQALANLNLAVHRCESIDRGARPRFVCTWFGLPKTKVLTNDLISNYGTFNPAFGTVCLNYAEIGKTLEDLTVDNDNYISKNACKPFNHYSADFFVRFYDDIPTVIEHRLTSMQQYFEEHKKYFIEQGFDTFESPRLLPYRLPVAQLIETMPREKLLEEIAQRQMVTKVTIE
jgi:hypothetical protein